MIPTLKADYLKNLLPVELVREVYTLAKEDQYLLLELLGPEKSAELFSKISGLGSTTIVEQLPSNQSIQIVKEMSDDQQVNLLRKIGAKDAEEILEEIKAQKAEKIRESLSYPENPAGALMITDYLVYASLFYGACQEHKLEEIASSRILWIHPLLSRRLAAKPCQRSRPDAWSQIGSVPIL